MPVFLISALSLYFAFRGCPSASGSHLLRKIRLTASTLTLYLVPNSTLVMPGFYKKLRLSWTFLYLICRTSTRSFRISAITSRLNFFFGRQAPRSLLRIFCIIRFAVISPYFAASRWKSFGGRSFGFDLMVGSFVSLSSIGNSAILRYSCQLNTSFCCGNSFTWDFFCKSVESATIKRRTSYFAWWMRCFCCCWFDAVGCGQVSVFRIFLSAICLPLLRFFVILNHSEERSPRVVSHPPDPKPLARSAGHNLQTRSPQ